MSSELVLVSFGLSFLFLVDCDLVDSFDDTLLDHLDGALETSVLSDERLELHLFLSLVHLADSHLLPHHVVLLFLLDHVLLQVGQFNLQLLL